QLRGAKEAPLGDVLEKLAFDHLKQEAALVVDAAAFRAAGLKHASRVPLAKKSGPAAEPVPLWECLGLVYVPCRAAALLTTRRQLELWQTAGNSPQSVSDAITEAVAEAAAHGHDRSGRSYRVERCLGGGKDAGEPEAAGTAALQPAPGAGAPGADWTEWEPVAGAQPEEALVVVRQEPLRYLGLALAGALCLAAWRLRRVLSA